MFHFDQPSHSFVRLILHNWTEILNGNTDSFWQVLRGTGDSDLDGDGAGARYQRVRVWRFAQYR